MGVSAKGVKPLGKIKPISMINQQHTKYFIFFVAGFFLCLILRIGSCEDTVIPTTPAKDIVTPAKVQAKKVDSAINKIAVNYKKTRDTITDLNKKLYAAWQENKRLRSKVSNSTPLENEQNFTPITTDGAQKGADYITETQLAAQTADSLCAEAITKYETALSQSDSIASHEKAKADIFQAAMNNLALQSDLKDMAIKSINRKLKWQKVQNVTFKAILIGAAAILIKNQL